MLASGSAAVLAQEKADTAAKPPAMQEQMMVMQGHMKLMQEQMSQIRAATDPKERERLMSEHMKTMQESMTKMQGMMGCGKMM